YTNLSAELLSIALTLSVISVLSRQSERRQYAQEREKATLLKRLQSVELEEKRDILKRLRDEDYLVDGTLHNLNMVSADLQHLDFSRSDMEGINLSGAKLSHSRFVGADLQGANLSKALLRFARCENARLLEANLTRADLQMANLTEADLRYAELENADLNGAILDAADLRGANLSGANLSGACLELRFDEKPFSAARFDGATILPDGSNWVAGVDLRRFTNPDHAEFWACAPNQASEEMTA
ncbi:MAG: pentapeptide repeat-containing protein, partial [Chloroflexota bacterium]